MTHDKKTGLIAALFLLSCATGAHAQGRGYYNRVAPSSRELAADMSLRGSGGRGGGFTTASGATRPATRVDPLLPYTQQALLQAQQARTGIPRGSSWEQMPPRTELLPATVQTRS